MVKWRELDEDVGGISSITDDNMHVGFFDCDNWKLNMRKLETIQEYFNLSTLYIIKTKENSYHIICLDKKDICDWIKIMRFWDNDMFYDYYNMSLRRNKFILRITEKKGRNLPELFGMLVRDNKEQKSEAHYKFLNVRYGILMPNKLDGLTRLEVEQYITVKSR